MLLALALSLPLITALPAQERDELATALAEAVDGRTTQDRARAAKKLAKGNSLEELLEAMRGFGDFAEISPGLTSEKPTLTVDGKQVAVDVHVYVPAKYSPNVPAPLMLSAHGTGGDGARHWSMWQPVADALGMLVLCPTTSGDNAGYTFKAEERLETLAALRWTRRHFNVDENRIYLAGVSRGGHLTWDLALRWPDRFAALAPMIGGPRLSNRDGQNTLRYVENVAHVPIRDLQGSGDDPRMLFNLRHAFARLEAAGATDAKLIEFEHLGHSFELGAVNWNEFLPACVREPVPQRVVRAVTNLSEARSSWLEVTRLGKKVKENFDLRVSPAVWAKLSDEEQRRKLQQEADKLTGRIEMTMTEVGKFEGEGDGVDGFRILLTQEMFDPGVAVQVKYNRRGNKRKAKASKEVLLAEFVERFDRTFLPVAEITVKR